MHACLSFGESVSILRDEGKEMVVVQGQLMVVSDRVMAQCYYRMARQYAAKNAILEALECMVDAFMARCGESHSTDQLWLEFYRRQFKRYLVGKHRMCCSLPEGDMIHDYLKDCYEQIQESIRASQIPFRGDMRSFLDAQELDFPYMEIEIESF